MLLQLSDQKKIFGYYDWDMQLITSGGSSGAPIFDSDRNSILGIHRSQPPDIKGGIEGPSGLSIGVSSAVKYMGKYMG